MRRPAPIDSARALAIVIAAGLVCVGAAVAVPLRAANPARSAPGPYTLPRSTPEAQGVASADVLEFIEEAERKIDALHSVMLVRHGHVVAEGWWAPYAAAEPHMMFSLSKSFTSTAVGFAVAEGRLRVDAPVLSFFPDEAPAEPSANLKAMRVRDLLTMSAGHHDEAIRDFPYTSEESVVRRLLSLPVAHKPGTFFLYNTPASYMLSAIVQKVTGQPLLEYLQPRLFAPLGIEHPTWEASKQGVSMGGFGLSVRTEDIARFGELYLRKGAWQGQQLLPAAWIEEATSRQVSNGSSPTSDWEQGYGYQFWRCRHGFYRGDGAHGQFCLVLPQYDAVIAITSGTRDLAAVTNLVWERLVPALRASALPADSAGHATLTGKLSGLTLRPQSTTATPAAGRTAVGKRYLFADNPQSIEAWTLQAAAPDGGATFSVRIGGAEQPIVAAPGVWTRGTLTLRGAADPVAVSGGWTAPDTYTLKVVRYRTPFATTHRLRFAADQLIVDSEQNVGAADARVSQAVGKIESTSSRQD